jgi:hypothetical protein
MQLSDHEQQHAACPAGVSSAWFNRTLAVTNASEVRARSASVANRMALILGKAIKHMLGHIADVIALAEAGYAL